MRVKRMLAGVCVAELKNQKGFYMSEIEYGVRVNIEKKLAQIEQDYQIKIILAVESGSRAWGFESTDSDYDVRFIYKNNPDWYIQVLPKRDVIELPINAIDDYSGWDIKKALIFLNKSNLVLFERLTSPIFRLFRCYFT